MLDLQLHPVLQLIPCNVIEEMKVKSYLVNGPGQS